MEVPKLERAVSSLVKSKIDNCIPIMVYWYSYRRGAAELPEHERAERVSLGESSEDPDL